MNKNLILGVIATVMLLAAAAMVAAGVLLRERGPVDTADASEAAETVPVAEATNTPVPTPIPPTATESAADAAPESADDETPPPEATPTDLPPTAAPAQNQAVTPLPAATPTPAETATPTQEPLGEAVATVAPPEYLADGRWAEVFVTVRNISVQAGVATGYTFINPNPDGGTRYVSLFEVDHQRVPQVSDIGDAPLWRGHVEYSDGSSWWFPTGCFYIETVDAYGWEPIGGPDGYFWEVHWEGGFFDCGNAVHKLPQYSLIMPGQEATIPLYVYLQHPRVWHEDGWTPPNYSIRYIGLEAFDAFGRSLGIIGEFFG